MSDNRPNPNDFLDERNRFVVEIHTRGWYGLSAHPTIFGARVAMDASIRETGRIHRIIDVRHGGRIVG